MYKTDFFDKFRVNADNILSVLLKVNTASINSLIFVPVTIKHLKQQQQTNSEHLNYANLHWDVHAVLFGFTDLSLTNKCLLEIHPSIFYTV